MGENRMKIAAITDDGQTISQHFGRAPFYLVLVVEEGQVVDRELRDKLGHSQFAHDEAPTTDDQGRHGYGSEAQDRHSRMAASIGDCQVLLCGGMGWGAYDSIKQAGIKPIVTDIVGIEAAVQAYLDGTIIDQQGLLH
jgi:predicted Fe-Mo cluster-binding NifX family protein